MNYLTQQHII